MTHRNVRFEINALLILVFNNKTARSFAQFQANHFNYHMIGGADFRERFWRQDSKSNLLKKKYERWESNARTNRSFDVGPSCLHSKRI